MIRPGCAIWRPTPAAGEEVVRQLLRKLARQGDVFQVVKDLFYTAANMDELARIIKELACATPERRSGGTRVSRRHRLGPQARYPDH